MPAHVPEVPDNLCEDAKTEWRRTAPELYRLKLLTICDLTTFTSYCTAYGRWIAAERGIAAMAEHDHKFAGLVTRNEKGNLVQNPLVRTAHEAANDMLKFAMQLGMTPVARMKLAIGPNKAPGKFNGLVAS
jgi:P27 family predicted phage terminase small subunit